MAKIRRELVIFLSLAVAIAGAFVFSDGITGLFGLESLTGGRLVYPNGTTAVLVFDNYSTSYVDHSVANPNVFAELCSDDVNNDLLDQYLSVYIVVGNNSIDIGTIPVQMVASSISGSCSVVDADISLYTGFYPAIVSFGVSNYSNMSGVSFYNLTIATGFLNGNFTIDPVNETVDNLTINVRYPVDENNNTYYVDRPLIVGVRNSSLDVVDSVIASLDDPVTLLRPNGSYVITINNIDQPGIFVPIVDIITPTDGQSITVGSSVLITVNVTGNITQVLVNVSWDATSELLNATFNSGTGLWEVPFYNTAWIGLYNVTAFAYDVNGNVGNDSSYFYIVSGPVGGGGGGGGGYVAPPAVMPPVVPPVVMPPVVPPAVEVPVVPPAVEVPVVPPAVAEEVAVPEAEFDICYWLYLLGWLLLLLLLLCVLVYVVYKYVLKRPVGKWLEWVVWVLIALILAVVFLNSLLCDELLFWPLVAVLIIILLVAIKFVWGYIKRRKQERLLEPLKSEKVVVSKVDLSDYDELVAETKRLKSLIRRINKK